MVCRPFVVPSVDLETCICDREYPRDENGCSYFGVLKVDPDKRTKAMKVAIQSQELATEAGRLLLSTRAKTQQLDVERLSNLKGRFETSDEAVIMEKVDLCAVSCQGLCAKDWTLDVYTARFA